MERKMIQRFFIVVFFLFLSGCAFFKWTGLAGKEPWERRTGPSGTLEKPAPWRPFEKGEARLAGGECRFFKTKVPSGWFWRVRLNATSTRYSKEALLSARILPRDPPWGGIPAVFQEKQLKLFESSREVVLGVYNPSTGDRDAVLELCQDGEDVKVRWETQIGPLQGETFPAFPGEEAK